MSSLQEQYRQVLTDINLIGALSFVDLFNGSSARRCKYPIGYDPYPECVRPPFERVYEDHPETKIPTLVGYVFYCEPHKTHDGTNKWQWKCWAMSRERNPSVVVYTRNAAVAFVRHWAFR